MEYSDIELKIKRLESQIEAYKIVIDMTKGLMNSAQKDIDYLKRRIDNGRKETDLS